MAQVILGIAAVTLKPRGWLHWEQFDLAVAMLRASKFKGTIRRLAVDWKDGFVTFEVVLGDKDCSIIDDGKSQLVSLFESDFDVTVTLGTL